MSGPRESPRLDFTERERKALRYCTYCPRLCRFACPVAHGEARETVTPWGLMRLLNLVDGGVVKADAAVLETLHHCVSCGRCTTFCLHDNPVAEVLGKGRVQLVGAGLPVPPSFAPSGAGGCGDALPVPGRPVSADEVPVFLPSCAHLGSPDDLARLMHALERLEALGIPMSLPSLDPFPGCGFHLWEVGHAEAGRSAWESLVAVAADQRAVTDCAPSLWLARQDAENDGHGPQHLLEWVAGRLDELPPRSLSGTFAVHDSCFVTRRLGLSHIVRDVIQHLTGSAPLSLFESKEEGRCCGAQGRWADVRPDAQARSADTVVDEIVDSGAHTVVTTSPACRRSLAERIHARGESIEVLDLLGLLALPEDAAK